VQAPSADDPLAHPSLARAREAHVLDRLAATGTLTQVQAECDYRQPPRPRGRADLPEVGVFADRGPRRPNRIGCTTCEVVSVRGRELRVRGLDAVDGTPVLDIKPVMRQFLPGRIRQPEWVDRLMADYFSR